MRPPSALRSLLALTGSSLLAVSYSHGATYYWDNNGTTSGLSTGAGTAGTWNGATNASNTYAIVPNGNLDGTTVLVGGGTATAAADFLYFGTNNLALGATASTIGTTGTININTIVFGLGQGAQGVTLGSGGTLAFGAALGTLTSNNSGANSIGAILSGTAGLTTAGPGTLTLTNASNSLTGTVTVTGGGRLNLGNGTSGGFSSTTNSLTFNAGGGTFNLAKADTGSQTMGALSFSAGEGSVISTAASGTATQTLTFGSFTARAAGATGNLSLATNTTAADNKIVLTSSTNAPVNGSGSNNQGLFFGGTEYTRYDTTAGYFRAVNYGTDFNTAAVVGTGLTLGINNAATDVKISGDITAQDTASVNTLNLAASNLTFQSTASTLSVNGILSAGSASASIANGTNASSLTTTASGGELVVRVNGSSDALTIAPNIVANGASTLTKSGAGTLTLSGTNTYTGTTTINAGTLALSNGAAIVNTGAVALANAAGATLLLNNSETIGQISGGGFSGGNVDVGANTLTIANANSQTFGGKLIGSGGVTISSGTLTLSNKNSFAGTISLLGTSQLNFAYGQDGTAFTSTASSGGTISMAGGTSLGYIPAAQVALGVAQSLQNQSGVVSGNLLGEVVSNPIVASSAGTITLKQVTNGVNNDRFVFSGGVTGVSGGNTTLSLLQGVGGGNAERSTLTMSGAIQNGSSGTLGVSADFTAASSTNQGAFITLTGLNTFTGPIVVSNTKGLAYTGASAYQGAWFVIGGEITSTFSDRTTTPGSGALGWNGSIGNYSGTISLATGSILNYMSSRTQTLGGVISGSGNLVKEGSGPLTLSAANTFTGSTTITTGKVVMTNPLALQNSAYITTGSGGANGLNVTSGLSSGVLTLGGLSGAVNLATAITDGYGSVTGLTLNNFNSSALTYTGNITGATGALTKNGTGTQILAGTNSFTGTTTLNGGTLTIGNGSAGSLNGTTGTPLTFGSTATFNVAEAAASNQGMGALTINSGDATVQSTFNATSANLTFGSLAARTAGTTATFIVSGGAIGASALNANGTLGTNNIKITGQAGQTAMGVGYFAGTASGSNYAFYDGAGFVRPLDYVNDAIPAGAATFSGAQTSLNSANYAQLQSGGSVSAQTSSTFTGLHIVNSANVAQAFTLAGGATVTLNGILRSGNGGASSTTTISGGTGIQAANNAEMVIRTDLANDLLTISTPILANGANTLTKSGAGSLTLSGANTFTGGITINGGTLTMSTAASFGGAGKNITFGGSGTLSSTQAYTGGAITVNTGATGIIQTVANVNQTYTSVSGAGNFVYSTSNQAPSLTIGDASALTGNLQLRYNGNLNYNGATALQFSNLSDTAGTALQFFATGGGDSTQGASITLANGTSALTFNNRQVQILARTTSNFVLRDNILTNNNAHPLHTWVINTDLAMLDNGNGGTRNFVLSGTNIGDNAFNGLISNGSATIALQKTGTGLWSVSNAANSYTGGTTVSAGTLRFSNGALGISGTINASGGTLQWGSSNTQDISSRLAMTAATTSTFDTNGNSVTFASAIGSSTTGALTKTGAGTLTLQGTNTYTGATTVNAGTLALDYGTNNTTKLADAAALTLGGGTLDLKGGSHTEVVASTTLTNSTASYVTRSSGTSVLQLGTITPGTGTLDIATASIATTNNTNTAGILGNWATIGGADWAINSTGAANGPITAYASYTDVNRFAGSIADGSTTNVRIVEGGVSGNLTLGAATTSINTLNQSISGGGSAATVDAAGKTLRTNGILMGPTAGALTIGTTAGSGTLSSTATGSIVVTNNSSNPLTINSVIANNTTTSLVKNGTGVLVLNGLSTYTGGTTLLDGTIRVGATVGNSTTNGILGGVFNTGITIANKSTAQFDINGLTAYVKDLKGGGFLGGNVTLGSGTLYIVNPAAGSYDGIISGTGNLTVDGSSGWTTNGLHTYTGITSIVGTAGFTTNALADGGIASGIGQSSNVAANLVFTGGGSLNYNSGSAATTDRRFTLGGNAGFQVAGTGAITWSNSAAITHSTTAAKTMTFGGNGAGLGTMAAQITDSGTGANITSLTKIGTSNWTLTNASSAFTGAITLNTTTTSAGTLSYASAGGANPINFNQTTSTATLSYIGATDKTMSGLIQANALTAGGVITLDASGTGAINYSNTGSLGVGGASGAKGLVLSGTNAGNNILAGGWSNNTLGGAATITKNGAGRWTLSGTNNYTGTTVVNAGTLQFAKQASLYNNTPASWTPANINVKSGATFAVNVDSAATAGFDSTNLDTLLTNISVAGSATAGLQSGAILGFDTSTATGSTFTQGNVIANSTGANGGAIGLTKFGAGTLILDKTNTYTGPTTVTGGTLAVNGSIASNSLTTVRTGGTLGGSGSLGPVTIDAGGFFAPGNSPGITTVNGLLTHNGTLSLELTGLTAGTEHDQVVVNGGIALNGPLSLSFNTFSPVSNDMLFVVLNDSTDAISGTFTGLNQGDVAASYGGYDWQISYVADSGTSSPTGGNDIVLVAVAPVPEPGVALLGSLGLLALMRRRRRH